MQQHSVSGFAALGVPGTKDAAPPAGQLSRAISLARGGGGLGGTELLADAFLDRLVGLRVAVLELALRGHDPLVTLGIELFDRLRRCRLRGGGYGDQQREREPASGKE